MGELIKNLQPIKIGSSELMIELNEGYTKDEGRLIHIQNKFFRYLLPERDFVCLASTILRAKAELEYVRNKICNNVKAEIIKTPKVDIVNEKAVAEKLCALFNESKLKYKLVEIREGICTFIFEYQSYKKTTLPEGLIPQLHPYNENLGYSFLYQMHPFKLYSYNNIYVEIYFELPCMSLTEKTWIPLHSSIQKRIWNYDIIRHNCHVIDGLSYVIYRLCWAIFKNKALSEYDVSVIEDNKSEILSKDAILLFQEVFYKYTDTLLEHISKNEYSVIVKEYYEFKKY